MGDAERLARGSISEKVSLIIYPEDDAAFESGIDARRRLKRVNFTDVLTGTVPVNVYPA
jgi:hypothetical protein